jgi:hypothetical protein
VRHRLRGGPVDVAPGWTAAGGSLPTLGWTPAFIALLAPAAAVGVHFARSGGRSRFRWQLLALVSVAAALAALSALDQACTSGDSCQSPDSGTAIAALLVAAGYMLLAAVAHEAWSLPGLGAASVAAVVVTSLVSSRPEAYEAALAVLAVIYVVVGDRLAADGAGPVQERAPWP